MHRLLLSVRYIQRHVRRERFSFSSLWECGVFLLNQARNAKKFSALGYSLDLAGLSEGDVNDIYYHLARHLFGRQYSRHFTLGDDHPHIVDVGGSWGIVALSFYDTFRDSGVTVDVFEPNPFTSSFAERLMVANGIDAVRIHRKGVASAAGTAHLTIPGGLLEAANIYGETADLDASTLPVELVSIDTVLGDGPLDLLKIDCEGAEFDILGSLIDTGRIDQVRAITAEVGALKGGRLMRDMTSFGLMDRLQRAGFDISVSTGLGGLHWSRTYDVVARRL